MVEHVHLVKDARILEGAADPAPRNDVGSEAGDRLSLEANLSGAEWQNAGDEIEQGRLPRAIRADQAGHRPLLHREACAIDGDEAAEAPRHIVDLEDAHRIVSTKPVGPRDALGTEDRQQDEKRAVNDVAQMRDE